MIFGSEQGLELTQEGRTRSLGRDWVVKVILATSHNPRLIFGKKQGLKLIKGKSTVFGAVEMGMVLEQEQSGIIQPILSLEKIRLLLTMVMMWAMEHGY